MANLTETSTFEPNVYQLETTDPVEGGASGVSNLQAKQLANRTQWLKTQVDTLNGLKGKGIAAFSTGSSYAGGDQVVYQGNIWKANTAIAPGAFNSANWTRQLGTAAEIAVQTSTTDATAGRAMLVGGFGLGGTSITLSAADAVNWQTSNGLYLATGSDIGNPGGISSVGYLVHLRASITATQIFYSAAAPHRSFQRLYVSGAWQPWTEIWQSGNLVKQTSATDITAGSVLTVGAFGLGVGIVATEPNMDNYITPGKYLTPTTGMSNLPPGWAQTRYTLDVSGYASSDYVFQVLSLVGADGDLIPRMAFRCKKGPSNGWTNWAVVWHDGNLVKQTSVIDATAGRALLVGAFGLGSTAYNVGGNTSGAPITMATIAALPTGLYRVGGYWTDGPLANPNNAGTVLWIKSPDTGYGALTYVAFADGRTFSRSQVGGNWNAWVESWTNQNLVKQSAWNDATAGRVMLNGAFGLGSTQITDQSGANLNSLVTTGFYYVTSPVNGPTAGTLNLQVIGNAAGSGRTIQIAQVVGLNVVYTRCQNAGVWTAWSEVWSATNNTISVGASSGWRKTADGLIEQWGIAILPTGVTSTPLDTTFPTAFPTACKMISGSIGISHADYDNNANYRTSRQSVSIGAPSSTGFEGQAFIDDNLGNARRFQWFAIGH